MGDDDGDADGSTHNDAAAGDETAAISFVHIEQKTAAIPEQPTCQTC